MPFCPISIHPPRVGRDWCRVMEPPASTAFQSTLPVWGGTMMAMLDHGIDGFQSTLPVRGGTHIAKFDGASVDISIHPPRKGRDNDIIETGSLNA